MAQLKSYGNISDCTLNYLLSFILPKICYCINMIDFVKILSYVLCSLLILVSLSSANAQNDGQSQALGSAELDSYVLMKALYLNDELEFETDILRYIEQTAYYGIPYEAALTLEKELASKRVSTTPDHYAQLVKFYWQAREYERGNQALRKTLDMLEGDRTLSIFPDLESIQKPIERMYFDQECGLMEELIAVTEIKEHDKPFRLLGQCLYEQADKLEGEDHCKFRNQEQFLKSTRGAALEKARLVFSSVPNNSPEYQIAQKYEQFIQLDIEASYDQGGSYCLHRRGRIGFKEQLFRKK